jgi:hypothetical protein
VAIFLEISTKIDGNCNNFQRMTCNIFPSLMGVDSRVSLGIGSGMGSGGCLSWPFCLSASWLVLLQVFGLLVAFTLPDECPLLLKSLESLWNCFHQGNQHSTATWVCTKVVKVNHSVD